MYINDGQENSEEDKQVEPGINDTGSKVHKGQNAACIAHHP